MRYSNRTLWQRIVASPLALLAAAIALVVLTHAGWNVYKRAESGAEHVAELQRRLERLDQRESELSQKVELLSSPDGLEAEIRTRFHAVRSGESVAVIVSDDASTSETASAASETRLAKSDQVAASAEADEKAGLWRRLLRIFGI